MPDALSVPFSSDLNLTSELFFESSPDCAKLLDASGNLLCMNRNGQCLMEIEDFSKFNGAPWPTLWPTANRADIEAALVQARQIGLGQFVAYCPTAKGTPKWWDVRVTPVRGRDGEIGGFLSVSRDITSIRLLTEEHARAAAFTRGQKQVLELAFSGAPLVEVLVALTAAAEQYSGNSMLASVLLLDQNTQRLRIGAAPSIPSTYNNAVDGMAIGPAAGSCGTAAYRKTPVFVRNIQDDPLWAEFRELAAAHGLVSCWSQPIVASDGSVLGTFAFYFQEMRDPTHHEEQAMPVLVHTAALVLERLRDSQERGQAAEELRQLAARLSEANRRKTEFLATLAHELRNPLAPIRNGLSVLRLAGGNPATQARVHDMMSRQVDHLVHLINDLLDVARIDSGKIELEKTRVELKSVIAMATEASLPMIDAAHHTLDVQVPDEPLMLDADPTRLAQVLSNLLNNAAKYTPEKGAIKLTLDRDDRHVVISVSDTGIGIPAHALPNVFDMFSQVDASEKRSQGGLGIGLALVRRLVEMHGGSVTASSPGIGGGSTFIVRLPLAKESGDQESGERSPGQAATATRTPLRILVADDNVDAAHTIAELLQLTGHETRIANDGHGALHQLSEYRPDVAFIDIGMPGLTGYEVALMARKTPANDNVVLVALTGWGAEADRRKTTEVGFDYHLTKPADIRAINQILETAQAA